MEWLSLFGELAGLTNRALGFLRGNGGTAAMVEVLARVEAVLEELQGLRDEYERVRVRSTSATAPPDELVEKARQLTQLLAEVVPALAAMDPHADTPETPRSGRRRTPTRRAGERRKAKRE
jgi:hypothetical protein